MGTPTNISFSFQTGVPRARRTELMIEIRSWPEVHHAGFIDPDSKAEVVAAMAYLVANDTPDFEALEVRLRALREIADVGRPAKRRAF